LKYKVKIFLMRDSVTPLTIHTITPLLLQKVHKEIVKRIHMNEVAQSKFKEEWAIFLHNDVRDL